jgi:hypothetical protein
VFSRLFSGADLKVRIIYRRMGNDNVIVVSELVRDVGESMVTNTDYRISMQVQRKAMGTPNSA